MQKLINIFILLLTLLIVRALKHTGNLVPEVFNDVNEERARRIKPELLRHYNGNNNDDDDDNDVEERFKEKPEVLRHYNANNNDDDDDNDVEERYKSGARPEAFFADSETILDERRNEDNVDDKFFELLARANKDANRRANKDADRRVIYEDDDDKDFFELDARTVKNTGPVITLQNRAAMNIRLRVFYTDANCIPDMAESGLLWAGQTKSVTLPGDSKNMRVTVQKDIFVNMWRSAYSANFTGTSLCIKITGVTLSSTAKQCDSKKKT